MSRVPPTTLPRDSVHHIHDNPYMQATHPALQRLLRDPTSDMPSGFFAMYMFFTGIFASCAGRARAQTTAGRFRDGIWTGLRCFGPTILKCELDRYFELVAQLEPFLYADLTSNAASWTVWDRVMYRAYWLSALVPGAVTAALDDFMIGWLVGGDGDTHVRTEDMLFLTRPIKALFLRVVDMTVRGAHTMLADGATQIEPGRYPSVQDIWDVVRVHPLIRNNDYNTSTVTFQQATTVLKYMMTGGSERILPATPDEPSDMERALFGDDGDGRDDRDGAAVEIDDDMTPNSEYSEDDEWVTAAAAGTSSASAAVAMPPPNLRRMEAFSETAEDHVH